jgi:dienelactone hydrolase
LEHLASHGYLVIAPESYMTFLFPSHQGFAEDFRYSLDFLESENANPASWLFGQVDTAHFGMAGHSMGGGSSILAAAADSRVRALITLAAAETTPSAIAQMPNISAPVRLITGDQDDIVDWQTNTQAMYNMSRPPRQLLLIQGGCHCGFLDNNIPFCDSGSLPRAEQLEITRREMVTFFDLYLKPDSGPWREVWGPEQADDPQIVLQSDPGIDLSPANQTGQGSPGSVVSYSVTVTNLDTQPTDYALMAEDYASPSAPPPWPVRLIPGRTPVLNTNESASVIVQVQLPDTPRPEETILISALSDRDGGTRQFATVTTGTGAKDR